MALYDNHIRFLINGEFWRLRHTNQKVVGPGLWFHKDPADDTERFGADVSALRDELVALDNFVTAQIGKSYLDIRVEGDDPADCLADAKACLAIGQRWADWVNAVVYAEAEATETE